MSFQLLLYCRSNLDVIERILRVIRHRGFTLNTMNMVHSPCGERLKISMTVSSHRPGHLLTTQLQKLHDVLQLNASTAMSDHRAIHNLD